MEVARRGLARTDPTYLRAECHVQAYWAYFQDHWWAKSRPKISGNPYRTKDKNPEVEDPIILGFLGPVP